MPQDWTTLLRADAMFYDAAVKSLETALAGVAAVNAAQQQLDERVRRLDELRALGGDEMGHELFGEYESICICLESDEIQLSSTYGPVLRSLASAQLPLSCVG